MSYKKIFDPKPLAQDLRSKDELEDVYLGDRRDGKIYIYTESLVLAINVALATGRPLLLRGSPGCGKSSVAYNIARLLKRPYYEKVIHSRMEAHDIFWRFDAVRRLGDAHIASVALKQSNDQVPQENHIIKKKWEFYHPYIEPEIMWWVFDKKAAMRRGLPENEQIFFPQATDPVIYKPKISLDSIPPVVLLDEIDKAEPDVPNNLLVALGSMKFEVEEIQTEIALHKSKDKLFKPDEMPLIIITTNEERQLPAAFMRRCIIFKFKLFDDPKQLVKQLVEIAEVTEGKTNTKLYAKVAETVNRIAKARKERTREKFEPNIAEYLDAVRACMRLGGQRVSEQKIEEILDRTIFKNAMD